VGLLQKTKVIKAEFKQTVYDNDQHLISSSSGMFILQQPNKFYWLIETPNKQIIVNDSKKIWNYQPDLEQVTVKPSNAALSATPLAILSGSATALTNNFIIQRINDQLFSLTAKQHGSFKYVWLYFNKGIISSMELQDALGQKTKLTFSKVRTDIQVPANQFKFTAPPKVDVIDSL